MITITNGGKRLETAKLFVHCQNITEAFEFFDYKVEEYPPHYFEHKRLLLIESAKLNQFALNDFMALG